MLTAKTASLATRQCSSYGDFNKDQLPSRTLAGACSERVSIITTASKYTRKWSPDAGAYVYEYVNPPKTI